jgi:signal transduction histidine kinase
MFSVEHYLRELRQMQLIQKKLTQKLESAQDLDRPDKIKEMVDDLDDVNNFATSLTQTLSTKKIKRELLTKLNHELRTPLVPIKGYTDMLLSEKFEVSDSPKGVGEIVINLIRDQNPDGLSGYTKSTADGNQILKTTITIYNADQLSVNQIGAIMRHEFGHAMGLAHSTAPEDLMHATIQTEYPYISGCDIDAIKGLYNGDENSKVVCKK